MKKFAGFFLCFFSFFFLQAQVINPIQWSFSQKRKNDSTEVLTFIAKLEKGYHLYSQYTPDGGPLATEIRYQKSADFTYNGKPKEPKPFSEFDQLFGLNVLFFKEEVVSFSHEIKILSPEAFVLAGEISGMTCNQEGCIPFDQVPFKFNIQGRKNSPVSRAEEFQSKVKPDTTPLSSGEIKVIDPNPIKVCRDYHIEGLQISDPGKKTQSYWLIFLLGIGGGLLALITPCVFPMIPLTVSFFTKNAGNKRKGLFLASLYGLSIVAIYTMIALPFVVSKIPPDILNSIATNAWLNIFFFLIFIFFAVSFFGFFEITLPSSLATKADKASNTGGLIGVFFMAVVLAIVSFSCTGPILGTFLAGTLATNPDPYNILFVMLGFGVALGLPFSVFAMFPALLNSLPKSGGWLNSVKVVLGFIELALAIKFLSNADLVMQWGLLKREIFLYIWSLIAFAICLYILGVFKFPHDSPVKRRGFARIGLSGFFLVAGLYFASGVFGANLNLISGFPPPMFYSTSKPNHQDGGPAGRSHCPQDIPCENDFEIARARSTTENKPLLIDFTGWACVNCRRMEEGVWVDAEVKKIMSKDYILVSLYVDEKRTLPENEKYISCLTGKRVETIGSKWSNFQLVNFNANAQPYYVLLSPDLKLLNNPIGYSGKDEFLSFLKTGMENFSKKGEGH